METRRDDFWDRYIRFQAVVLLAAQATILIVGLVYLFVRGADVRVVILLVVTLYSLKPARTDRATVPAAVVAWLGKDRAVRERDLKAS